MIVGRFPKDRLLAEVVGIVCSLLEERALVLEHTDPKCPAPIDVVREDGPVAIVKYFGVSCSCDEIEVSLEVPRGAGGTLWTCEQAKAWV